MPAKVCHLHTLTVDSKYCRIVVCLFWVKCLRGNKDVGVNETPSPPVI